MKVLLMHPDRDFDPEEKFPPGDRPARQRYGEAKKFNFSPTEAALVQDLELETVFQAMAQGDEFLYQVAVPAVLSSLDGPDLITYRQEILRDCLNQPDIVRQIYRIPIRFMERKRASICGGPGATIRVRAVS